MATDPKLIAAKHYRRNFILGMISGASFGFVDSIISPFLVLTVFVNSLGAPNFVVGLMPSIANGCWYLPQFLISHRLQELPQKKRVYISTSIVRFVCWMLITLAAFWIGDHPLALLIVFFALFTTYSLAAGIAGTPFMDIVAKTIPVRRRGIYFGGRDLGGALTAIGAGDIVGILLNPDIAPRFPINFGLLFLIAGFAITIGLGTFSLVIEPAEINPTARIKFYDQLHAARAILRENHDYRRFLLTRIVIALADVASPFYAIYATVALKIPAEMIGVYIGITTIASLVANPFWSRLSYQRGNRIVVLGATSCLALVPVIAFIFSLFPVGVTLGLPFGILFVLSGIARPAANISYPSYLLEIAPARERSLYIGLTNTILGVATFVPVLGGLLLDLFGFRFVFLLAFAIALAARWLAQGLSEPRQKQESGAV